MRDRDARSTDTHGTAGSSARSVPEVQLVLEAAVREALEGLRTMSNADILRRIEQLDRKEMRHIDDEGGDDDNAAA